MQDTTSQENDNREVRPDDQFEGSRPGKGTAILVACALLAVVIYSFWPQIASALDVG